MDFVLSRNQILALQIPATKSCIYIDQQLNVCAGSCPTSPWYNRTGWLGIKHQVTYLPVPQPKLILALYIPTTTLLSGN